MNWGETKKTRGRGREKEASRHLPQPFSCLTSVQLFAQLHYSCIFLKNTSENHAKKKPAGDLPTFCPPCQGLTKTSKVWVQTNIFLTRKWLDLVIRNTFSSVNALMVILICEAETSLFGWWLQQFILYSEKKFKWIKIPRHRVTFSPGSLGSWRAELATAAVVQKVRNPDDVVSLDNMLDILRWVRWFILPRRH